VQARARLRTSDSTRPSVAKACDDLDLLPHLEAAQRRAWEAVLDYYEAHFASLDLVFDSSLIATTNRIAELESRFTLEASGLDPALVQILEAAATPYRAVWWPQHDATNRAWVAAMDPVLDKDGATLLHQAATALQTVWPTQAFRVDVRAYANWGGAYTTIAPPRITLASTDHCCKAPRV
jgi:hypothetical protein